MLKMFVLLLALGEGPGAVPNEKRGEVSASPTPNDDKAKKNSKDRDICGGGPQVYILHESCDRGGGEIQGSGKNTGSFGMQTDD